MKINRGYLLIELSFLFAYFFLILFSIILQPINLILGFILVFILPGYNLISILKPQYSFSEKLGYVIILSLAIESALMLLSYILLYNFESGPESNTRGFIFNPTILISAILLINLILIFIKRIKNHKIGQNKGLRENNFFKKLGSLKRRIKPKNLIIITSLFISLLFLCVSTLYSEVPNNDYSTNYEVYRTNFTFFSRVPLIFYFFLIFSLLSLTYIIFSIKNSYITLACLSIFLYCLWILPYLQIGNFFNHDSYNVLLNYEIYLENGILSQGSHHFIIYNFDALRYSTSLFSSILLTSATGMEINFVLWYLFPLFYIFLPFFFYSVLKKYSSEKKNNEIILIILVIFILFTPQFLKYGHASGTGVLGLIVFLILVVEFFNLMQENKFNVRNSLIIVLLYLFLSLTHTEECIYFLILIILYNIYYFFFKIKKIELYKTRDLIYSNSNLKRESLILEQNIDIKIEENNLKTVFVKSLFLLIFLSLIFYFTLTFFGYFRIYFQRFLGIFEFLNSFYNQIANTQIKIPFFFRGGGTISLFFIITIILAIILLFIFLYLLFFQNHHIISRVYNFTLKIFTKIFYFIKKLISSKIFHIIVFPLIFVIIILVNLKILGAVERGNLLLTIITLFLSYSTMLLHIFFFIKGILFYKIENDKQNFYLLTILASASILGVLMISNIWLAIYVLHTKFLVILVFCNSIIIQETYFKEYVKGRKIQLIFLIFSVLVLGVWYSLRTLAYG